MVAEPDCVDPRPKLRTADYRVLPPNVGGFEVPDHFAILLVRCPRCRGRCMAESGEITCLMCSRRLVPTRVTIGGRILAVEEADRPERPSLSRALQLQEQRTQRGLGQVQGTNGRAAALLKHLPDPPEHATVSFLAKKLTLSNALVRETLEELVGFGYVCRVLYRRGAVPRKQEYVGYARSLPPSPA